MICAESGALLDYETNYYVGFEQIPDAAAQSPELVNLDDLFVYSQRETPQRF